MANTVTARRYVWLRNHCQWHCHGKTTYGPGGGRTFARSFTCVCGEPLHDGDQGYDVPGGFAHTNCYRGEALPLGSSPGA